MPEPRPMLRSFATALEDPSGSLKTDKLAMLPGNDFGVIRKSGPGACHLEQIEAFVGLDRGQQNKTAEGQKPGMLEP